MGDREKQRGQDSFHLKNPAILRMRLVLDGLSLDMMIVGRESRSEAVRWIKLISNPGAGGNPGLLQKRVAS